MTVAVPIRQMKGSAPHISWNDGPVFRDFNRTNKQKSENRKKEEDTGISS